MKKIIIICIVLLGIVFLINFGKIPLTSNTNQIATNIGFADNARKYAKSLEVNCDIKSKDSVPVNINKKTNGKLLFMYSDNSLNQRVKVVILNNKQKEISNFYISAGSEGNITSKIKLDSGIYHLLLVLPRNTKGKLFLSWEEANEK